MCGPPGEVDLAQVAAHVRDVLSGMAQELGCELHVASDGPLMVPGSRDELVQVVQNLAENALKYASSGKLVEIDRARRTAAWPSSPCATMAPASPPNTFRA